MKKNDLRFQRWGLLTIASVYFLILVGGIVRSTGSGMGCPDWPKCFGSWIPPTQVSQLPENYQEVYAGKRKAKNEKLGGYLEKIGFSELADKIINDLNIYKEADFNATKTWIEYINRLIGVLIGVFIFLTLLFSVPFIKTDRQVFYLSSISFILVGVQGWLGSIVVSTNLLPGIITVHMMLALLIVCLLIWAVAKVALRENMMAITGKRQLSVIIVLAMLISLIQLMMGTQVRENIDVVANALGGQSREMWIEKLGIIFYFHRSFSWLVAGVHVYLWFIARKNGGKTHQVTTFATFLLLIIGVEFASGVGMAYFGMPAWLQPVHLLLASLTIGIQFAMLLWLNPTIFGINKKYISENQKIHS